MDEKIEEWPIIIANNVPRMFQFWSFWWDLIVKMLLEIQLLVAII